MKRSAAFVEGIALITLAFSCSVYGTFVEDAEFRAQPGLSIINASTAYSRSITGLGINIGVIDTGINPNHVEFSGAITIGFDFISERGVLIGTSPSFHGSHVTGIIGARRDGSGMHGVAYDANFTIARGIGGSLPATNSAIDFTITNNSRVINNSWGSCCTILNSRAAIETVFGSTIASLRNAVSNDAVVVFASGNNARDQPDIFAGLPYHYPEFESNWIAVGSIAPDLTQPNYTNHCGVAASWCVVAPGGGDNQALTGINSVDGATTTGFKNLSGTSMAAPHVSGAVALVAQQFPYMTGAQLTSVILTTATDRDSPGIDSVSGRGLLNVAAAINGPAALEFDFSVDTKGHDSTWSNDISGSGSLVKLGSGSLTLSGDNTFSGGTSLDGGTISISSDFNLGDADAGLSFSGGTLLTTASLNSARGVVLHASGGTFDTLNNALGLTGVVSGTGALIKEGAGTLTLSGANTYTGPTTILNGLFKADGSFSSPFAVLSGSTLGGTGSIESLSNVGIVAPGNSIGTLTINNNFSQNSGGTLEVEFNDAGLSDILDINGMATLAGAVSYQPEPGSYARATTYVFIQAADGVFGKFDSESISTETRLGGLTIRTIYNLANVQFLLETANYIDLIVAGHAGQMATHLDGIKANATGDFQTIIHQLNVLDSEKLIGAMNQLDAEPIDAIVQVSPAVLTASIAPVSSRLSSLETTQGQSIQAAFLGPPPRDSFEDGGLNLSDIAPILAAFPQVSVSREGRSFWTQGYAHVGDQEPDGESSGFDYLVGGLTTGLDWRSDNGRLLGITASYSIGKVEYDQSRGGVDVDTLRVGVYGQLPWKSGAIAGVVGLGYQRYDSTRNIVFTGTNRTATADFGGWELFASLQATGGGTDSNAWQLSPFARLTADLLFQDSYNETGANSLNLAVDSRHTGFLTGEIGATLQKTFLRGETKYRPVIGLGLKQGWRFDDDGLTQRLPTGGDITLSTNNSVETLVSPSVGLSAEWRENATLFVQAKADIGSDRHNYRLTAGIHIVW